MEGFVNRLKNAVAVSEEFYNSLSQHKNFEVTRVANGTNLTRVTVTDTDIDRFRAKLAEKDILIGRANEQGGFTLSVNETWNRTSSRNLMQAFSDSLA